MNNFFTFTPPNSTDTFNIKKSKLQRSELYDKTRNITISINENIKKMQYFLNYPNNSDVKIRTFNTIINSTTYKSAIIFFDGLVDSDIIDNYILRQLMKDTPCSSNKDLEMCILDNVLAQNQLETEKEFDKIIDKLLIGNCVLFIDTIDTAFICDTKKIPCRSVNKSENEMSTRGPSEAFVENLRTNTGLIRKHVKDEHLIFNDIPVGRNSQTICSIAYISNITNDSIVDEVVRRVSSIDIDYLIDSGQLEQLIEDKTYMTSPLVLTTERPDKVAMHLFEGRVAILVAGSPNALIVPAVLVDFMHTAEDDYMRYPYSILFRLFRFPAALISTLLPGIYIAIVTFHQEMLPTDLLFSIAATREKVPFPLLVELLIMEIAFEIIREASLRTPTPMRTNTWNSWYPNFRSGNCKCKRSKSYSCYHCCVDWYKFICCCKLFT